MLPDFSNRIGNLVKALETVIVPSLPPENEFAQEQASLVIGHLRLLACQAQGAYAFEVGTLRNLQTFATRLLALDNAHRCGQSESLQAALEALPEELPLLVDAVAALHRALGLAIDDWIRDGYTSSDADFKQCVFDTVLDFARLQSTRERVWFKENHLDPDTRDLTSMHAMLIGMR